MKHIYAIHAGRATNTESLSAFASLPTSSGTLENVLEQGSQTLFGAGECLHRPSFNSRTFANSVRKQCSAGVNAPLDYCYEAMLEQATINICVGHVSWQDIFNTLPSSRQPVSTCESYFHTDRYIPLIEYCHEILVLI